MNRSRRDKAKFKLRLRDNGKRVANASRERSAEQQPYRPSPLAQLLRASIDLELAKAFSDECPCDREEDR